jgi:hypothetical protein
MVGAYGICVPGIWWALREGVLDDHMGQRQGWAPSPPWQSQLRADSFTAGAWAVH